MSTGHVLILGAIAGGTIFLGLPIGRLQNLRSEARAGLSALATGILLFLLWDVLSGAVEPIEAKLTERHWGSFAGFSARRPRRVRARPDGARLLLRVDEAAVEPPRDVARRPRRGRARRVQAARLGRGHDRRPAPRAPDRGRHRRPQLRRGARDRPGGGDRRREPRGDADRRLRAAQRDRGLRHLRPDERRGHASDLGLPRGARPDRRRADVLRHACSGRRGRARR